MLVTQIICLMFCLLLIRNKLKTLKDDYKSNGNNIDFSENEDVKEIQSYKNFLSESAIQNIVLIIFFGLSLFYMLIWVFMAVVFPFHPFWWRAITAIIVLIIIMSYRTNTMAILKIYEGKKVKISKYDTLTFMLDLGYLILGAIILVEELFIK